MILKQDQLTWQLTLNILKTTVAFVANLGTEYHFKHTVCFFYLAHQGQSWPWDSQMAD